MIVVRHQRSFLNFISRNLDLNWKYVSTFDVSSHRSSKAARGTNKRSLWAPYRQNGGNCAQLSLLWISASFCAGRLTYSPLTFFGIAIMYSTMMLISSNRLPTTSGSSVSICPGWTASLPVTRTTSRDCWTITGSPLDTRLAISSLMFFPFSPRFLQRTWIASRRRAAAERGDWVNIQTLPCNTLRHQLASRHLAKGHFLSRDKAFDL